VKRESLVHVQDTGDSRLPGVPDTGNSRLPGILDTGDLQLPGVLIAKIKMALGKLLDEEKKKTISSIL